MPTDPRTEPLTREQIIEAIGLCSTCGMVKAGHLRLARGHNYNPLAEYSADDILLRVVAPLVGENARLRALAYPTVSGVVGPDIDEAELDDEAREEARRAEEA